MFDRGFFKKINKYKGINMSKDDYNLRHNLKDTLKVEGKFDLLHYSDNVNQHLNYIQTKIQDFEIKITSLRTKEKIISDIIDRTNNTVGKFFSESNYAKAQGLQNALITQFETFSLMQDMILKYENNIQSYIKMSLDIENNKVATYSKIKTADKNVEKEDGQYADLMDQINTLMSGGNSAADFKAQVQKELQLEGY